MRVQRITTRVRVLSPVEVDDVRSPRSPAVVVVAWFAVHLDDGRMIEGPIETRIGTGLTETEASDAAIRALIEASLQGGSNFRIDPADRWERLIGQLTAHGVDTTPADLDAADRDIAIDLGHLAR